MELFAFLVAYAASAIVATHVVISLRRGMSPKWVEVNRK